MKGTTDGTVLDVIPQMAADKAGIAPGMKVAVNNRQWSPEGPREAIQVAKGNSGDRPPRRKW